MQSSDLIASIGVSILLFAFLLQIFKFIPTESATYGWLNFAEAAIAGYASWLIPFMPFVILEGAWALVALYSLIKIYAKK